MGRQTSCGWKEAERKETHPGGQTDTCFSIMQGNPAFLETQWQTLPKLPWFNTHQPPKSQNPSKTAFIQLEACYLCKPPNARPRAQGNQELRGARTEVRRKIIIITYVALV